MPTLEQNKHWQAARAIPCPFCHAEAGKPCTMVTIASEKIGTVMRVHHRARYQAAGVVE